MVLDHHQKQLPLWAQSCEKHWAMLWFAPELSEKEPCLLFIFPFHRSSASTKLGKLSVFFGNASEINMLSETASSTRTSATREVWMGNWMFLSSTLLHPGAKPPHPGAELKQSLSAGASHPSVGAGSLAPGSKRLMRTNESSFHTDWVCVRRFLPPGHASWWSKPFHHIHLPTSRHGRAQDGHFCHCRHCCDL